MGKLLQQARSNLHNHELLDDRLEKDTRGYSDRHK